MSSAATNGWSVNNVARRFGVYTKTAIHTAWQAGATPPATSTTFDVSRVQEGIDYLVAHGFATFADPAIAFTNIGADGKPAHLRRNGAGLELLPEGEKPTDGT